MPSTKPNLTSDSGGICGACQNFKHRKGIGWSEPTSDFKAISDQYVAPINPRWDYVIPIIASGGAGKYSHIHQAVQAGASAVAAGAMFQFTQQTPAGARDYLPQLGIPVRHG